MNNTLKARIIEIYGKQWMFARAIKVDDSMVSKIVTGCRELSEKEKTRWAKALKTSVEIFNH